MSTSRSVHRETLSEGEGLARGTPVPLHTLHVRDGHREPPGLLYPPFGTGVSRTHLHSLEKLVSGSGVYTYDVWSYSDSLTLHWTHRGLRVN